MIWSICVSATLLTPTFTPSRRIVTRSQICVTSCILCEMYTTPTPCRFRMRTRSNMCCTSLSGSAADGSSMISTFASVETALAISTSCCSRTDSNRTGMATSNFAPSSPNTLRASPYMRFQRTLPNRPWNSSRLRKMFSATERLEKRLNSWWIMAIPTSRDSPGSLNRTDLPP